MQVCYVVQRYGASIAGGAEQHCREIARRMARRGHDVEVATTRATSYVDWADALPAGSEDDGGVTVHRFGVATTRERERFDRLTGELLAEHGIVPLEVQREWMRRQGPDTPDLVGWLDANAHRFDAVVCFTYLYWTTWAALRCVAGRVPTCLHPTVHDEPALRLSLFDEVFRAPDAFAFSTPEEADLVRGRFGFEPRGSVVGVGVDARDADPESFRRAFGALGDAPYLLYAGRLDPGKGGLELYDFFVRYKARNGGDLRLVLLGDPLVDVTPHPDVVVTGFVPDAVRDAALAGALALAQPSRFESFSMVLTEAFAHGRPAMVRRDCAVTYGHARRSAAAIPYSRFDEFEVALDALVARPGLADLLGARGRAYVEREYRWDAVLDRYESLLAGLAAR